MPPFVPLTKKGLTAREVLMSCPRATHDRATRVSVGPVRATPTETGQSFTAQTKTTRADDGSPIKGGLVYTTTVQRKGPHGHIEIDCTCGYHPFYGAEVALHLRQAAKIIRSNGRAPKVRNAAMVPLCCKHSVALINKLRGGGKLK
jgi:hypothetical protein